MTFLFVKYFNNSTKSTDTSSAFMDIKNAHHMALNPPPLLLSYPTLCLILNILMMEYCGFP